MTLRNKVPLLTALAAITSLAAAIVLVILAMRGAPLNRAGLVLVCIIFGAAISRLLRSRRGSGQP